MDANDTDRIACRALALAVLEQALLELKTARLKRWPKQEQKVLAWINSDADRWVFDFVPLCQWLGFNVELMRSKVKGLR